MHNADLVTPLLKFEKIERIYFKSKFKSGGFNVTFQSFIHFCLFIYCRPLGVAEIAECVRKHVD